MGLEYIIEFYYLEFYWVLRIEIVSFEKRKEMGIYIMFLGFFF